MPEISVRHADPHDAEAIADLIHALELHYGGEACSIEETLAMVRASIEAQEGTRYALASSGTEPVGLACFALLRPGFRLTGLLFLKELYIAEHARGQGAGEALMRWLAAFARAQNIGRIDLTTDGRNRGAQAFYERLGVDRMDKVFYRFNLASEVLDPE